MKKLFLLLFLTGCSEELSPEKCEKMCGLFRVKEYQPHISGYQIPKCLCKNEPTSLTLSLTPNAPNASYNDGGGKSDP